MSNQQKFIGRENELKILNERYFSKNSELGIVYGNRRIGKTTFLKEFSKNKPSIYLSCEKNSSNLIRLKKELEQHINNPLFEKIMPNSFYDLFENFINSYNKKEKLVIIIDEFPFMIEFNKSIISEFQRIWDELLVKNNIFLILNGSSFSVMVEEVLGQKSPLYGRKTFSINLKGLKYKDLIKICKCEKEDFFKYYSILGETTLYWTLIDNKLSFVQNIENIFLKKSGTLYNEFEFIMIQSFRETKNYSLILDAIANGKNTFNEIVNFTQIDKSAVFRYIEILKQFNYIESKKSIFFKPNSKNTRYFLKNNYFIFYYNFIKPYNKLLELDRSNEVIEKINFNIYFSKFYEDICKEYVFEKFNLYEIGSYWYKDKEIDIIGYNDDLLVLGEVKWNDNISNLKEKLENFEIPKEFLNHKKVILIFSKNKINNSISYKDIINFLIK
jgi:uncharacterized protein